MRCKSLNHFLNIKLDDCGKSGAAEGKVTQLIRSQQLDKDIIRGGQKWRFNPYHSGSGDEGKRSEAIFVC